MQYRLATRKDLDLLAEWNHQLIQDEGHRNRMTVPQLRQRMKIWIRGGYTAVIFEAAGEAVAYALYRVTAEEVYLRQFFVARGRRRQGIGRRAMAILFHALWPGERRLLVEVLCRNTAALQFWRAMGYEDYTIALEIMPQQRHLRS